MSITTNSATADYSTIHADPAGGFIGDAAVIAESEDGLERVVIKSDTYGGDLDFTEVAGEFDAGWGFSPLRAGYRQTHISEGEYGDIIHRVYDDLGDTELVSRFMRVFYGVHAFPFWVVTGFSQGDWCEGVIVVPDEFQADRAREAAESTLTTFCEWAAGVAFSAETQSREEDSEEWITEDALYGIIGYRHDTDAGDLAQGLPVLPELRELTAHYTTTVDYY